MTTSAPNEIVERAALRRRLARAVRAIDGASASHPLLDRVGADIIDRLMTVLRTFEAAVVLSPWPSDLGAKIAELERVGSVLNFRVLGDDATQSVDDELLPFAPESLDLFISVLALQATNDLPGALIQARRSLRPDGLFLGALLAGQTLTELRACLLEAESAITGGVNPRVLPFADVRDLGALMQRTGFALPVADTDTVCVTYETPLHLLRELRAFGATNVLAGRSRTLTRRDVIMRAMEIYAERFALPDGRISATIDIVTLTGWTPSPDQQQPLKPGSAATRLSDALNTAEHKLHDMPSGEGTSDPGDPAK